MDRIKSEVDIVRAVIVTNGTAEKIAALVPAVPKRQDFSIGEKPEVITRSHPNYEKSFLKFLI